ncbi:MAG TPA: nucleotidyl transferase AbiEii/AbiGii toxin family protein [Candidatus Dojkabacteria bacterium]
MVISREHYQLIAELQSIPSLSSSYLAGGTNLALRFNHRRSIDIDLFLNHIIGKTGFETIETEMRRHLGNNLISIIYPCKISDQFIFMRAVIALDGVNFKVEVLQNMKNVDSFEIYENIRLATIKDVGLFKLISCSRRGSKKDIYDLDYITDELTLSALLNELKIKQTLYNGKEFETIFDLDSTDNPIDDPSFLLKFESIESNQARPGHSSDYLDIISGNKTWAKARLSWRLKVRQIFRDGNLEFPRTKGLETNE